MLHESFLGQYCAQNANASAWSAVAGLALGHWVRLRRSVADLLAAVDRQRISRPALRAAQERGA